MPGSSAWKASIRADPGGRTGVVRSATHSEYVLPLRRNLLPPSQGPARRSILRGLALWVASWDPHAARQLRHLAFQEAQILEPDPRDGPALVPYSVDGQCRSSAPDYEPSPRWI